MPLPVVANHYQVVCKFTAAGLSRPATVHMIFRDVPGTQTEADLWTDFNAQVLENMWAPVYTNATITTVVNTKLDGTSAGVIHTTDATAKWTGSGGTDPILQGSCVVSFKTSLRGQRKRGRTYLPWIGEINNTAGVIDAATITSCQTAWNSFVNAMQLAGWNLAVIDHVAQTGHDVTSVVVRNYLKTQRRRALR